MKTKINEMSNYKFWSIHLTWTEAEIVSVNNILFNTLKVSLKLWHSGGGGGAILFPECVIESKCDTCDWFGDDLIFVLVVFLEI